MGLLDNAGSVLEAMGLDDLFIWVGSPGDGQASKHLVSPLHAPRPPGRRAFPPV
jgi:hypothetical protein